VDAVNWAEPPWPINPLKPGKALRPAAIWLSGGSVNDEVPITAPASFRAVMAIVAVDELGFTTATPVVRFFPSHVSVLAVPPELAKGTTAS
jgi:hypothetical protein